MFYQRGIQTLFFHIEIFSYICNWKFYQLLGFRLHPVSFSSGCPKTTTPCIMHYSSHAPNHNTPHYSFLFPSFRCAPSPTCQARYTVLHFNYPGLRKCHVVLGPKNRRCSSVNIFIACQSSPQCADLVLWILTTALVNH